MLLRKIFAVVLVITMVALFAACGGNKNETTTLDPLNTAYYPVTTNGQNSGQNNAGNGVTYILTTNQGKTAPVLNTTRFSIPTTTLQQGVNLSTNNYNNITFNTNASIPVPTVNTTGTYSTTWATIATTAPTVKPTTTLPRITTTRPTTEPTTEAQPIGVNVVINDIFTDSDGRVCATINSDGWGGKLKSNSQRISVYVDGVEMEEKATLQISSSTTGDGYQYVYLKLADYEIDPSSSTITFVIPEGFLENKTGTKYNFAYEVSM